MPVSDVKEQMDKIFGIDAIQFIRIAAEKHKDGTDHRHVLVMLRNQRMFTSSSFADLITAPGPGFMIFHGNYQAAKSLKAVYFYVSKSGDYISFGEDPGFKEKAGGALAEVAGMLMSGSCPGDIMKSHPTVYFMQRKKIFELYADMQTASFASNLETWDRVGMQERLRVAKERGTMNAENLRVLEWVTTNMCSKRTFKQKQLFLYGPPNFGKTSLIRVLSRFGAVYFAPTDEQFFDSYDEKLQKLVVFDEFKGQHPVTFMNQFLEMGVMTLRKKGSQYLRTKNLPVVILSNHPLSGCYKNVMPQSLAPMEARLEMVELYSPIFPVLEEILACHGLTMDD